LSGYSAFQLLQYTGSLKKKSLFLKFYISFNLRNIIMEFVVKCSATHRAFVPCSLHIHVHLTVSVAVKLSA
jgi:hypothetical protein